MGAVASRRRLLAIGLALALVLAAALALLAGRLGAGIEAIGPGDGSFVSDSRVTIGAELGWSVADAHIVLSGRDVTDSAVERDGRLVLEDVKLDDGRYRVEVSARSFGPLGRDLSESWSFKVDTEPPPLDAEVSRFTRDGRTPLRGQTEPRAALTAAIGDEQVASAEADRRGRYRLPLHVEEGDHIVLVTATDAAGNATEVKRSLTADSTPPKLDLAQLGPALDTASPALAGRVRDKGPVTVTVSVDGTPTASGPVPVEDDRFEVSAGELTEGAHTVEVLAEDGAGNATNATREVVVDSTEEFGAATLGPGARGADVRELLTYMRRYGGHDGPVRSSLGGAEVAAIERIQRREGLEVDGLAGPAFRGALLRALRGRVVIDISAFTLTLYRDDIPTKSYPVAVGQPQYPTPRGSFEIVDKQVDPAWTPPDSPWAAELDTIPPGPGNPLGTRWIGTSAPAIGVHGTYATDSIGTQASHGCVRMFIDDVEDLYEEVELGMPIEFRG